MSNLLKTPTRGNKGNKNIMIDQDYREFKISRTIFQSLQLQSENRSQNFFKETKERRKNATKETKRK